jgi:hypothetical protein
MTWVSTMFHQGGSTTFMITALIIPGLVVVGLHIGLRRKWSLWTAIGTIALILGIGVYGMMVGRGRIEDAVRGDVAMTNEDRTRSLEDGYSEARVPMKFAAVVAAVLLGGVVVAQLRKK